MKKILLTVIFLFSGLAFTAGYALAEEEQEYNWFTIAAANAVKASQSGSISQIFKAFADSAVAENTDEAQIPSWLKRIEIESDFNSEDEPQFSILTVQPFYQSQGQKDTIFTQVRAAYGPDERTTGNLGFGYRRLMLEDKLILGANIFYDYEWPYDHQRMGAGAEIRSSAIELNSNYYNGLSSAHVVNAAGTITEEALDGYDVELGIQVPYLPWAKIFAGRSFYDRPNNSDNVNGESYSIRMRPPLYGIEIEAGHNNDNINSPANFVEVRYRHNFGTFPKNSDENKWVDYKPFRFNKSVKSEVLDKVRRSNSIKVERTGSGTASISMQRGT